LPQDFPLPKALVSFGVEDDGQTQVMALFTKHQPSASSVL
jgi:hypothetical protein